MMRTEALLVYVMEQAIKAIVSVAVSTEATPTPFFLGITQDHEPISVELPEGASPNFDHRMAERVAEAHGQLLVAVFASECAVWEFNGDRLEMQDALVISGVALGLEPVGSIFLLDRSHPLGSLDRATPGYVEGLHDQPAQLLESLVC